MTTRTGADFRFASPDVRHFCLVKVTRAVSDYNACIELAKRGYAQQVCVLIRTMVECLRHAEYVIEPFGSEEHRTEAIKLVKEFFADGERGTTADPRKYHVQQGRVHDALGEILDQLAVKLGDTEGRRPARLAYRHSYAVLSNYVHSRYPECMDLYGGRPGQFHCRGMKGTPKDLESFVILEQFGATLSQGLALVVQGLGLQKLVESDPIISAWYKTHVIAAS